MTVQQRTVFRKVVITAVSHAQNRNKNIQRLAVITQWMLHSLRRTFFNMQFLIDSEQKEKQE